MRTPTRRTSARSAICPDVRRVLCRYVHIEGCMCFGHRNTIYSTIAGRCPTPGSACNEFIINVLHACFRCPHFQPHAMLLLLLLHHTTRTQLSELGRPFTGGSWCGAATGPQQYFSETSTVTASVKVSLRLHTPSTVACACHSTYTHTYKRVVWCVVSTCAPPCCPGPDDDMCCSRRCSSVLLLSTVLYMLMTNDERRPTCLARIVCYPARKQAHTWTRACRAGCVFAIC